MNAQVSQDRVLARTPGRNRDRSAGLERGEIAGRFGRIRGWQTRSAAHGQATTGEDAVVTPPSISGDAFAGKPITELSLVGKEFPRTLSITSNRSFITVALYVESNKRRKRIVFATVKIGDCYLAIDKYTCALWIGSTAFDVSEEEARQIRAKCEPTGLNIEVTP